MEIPVSDSDKRVVDRISSSKDPPVTSEAILAEALRLIINLWRKEISETGLASHNGDQPL